MSAVLNILVADERSAAQEAATLIQRWGHRVQQAHDGFEAVGEARLLMPQLMFVGLALPGLNGFGVAQQVHESPELADVQFTALLRDENEVSLHELKRAGFAGSLVKPIVPLELLTAIVKSRDVIERSRTLARSANATVARGRTRAQAARQGLQEYKAVIETSRQSLSRPLPAVSERPRAPHLLLEALLAGSLLDADQTAVASKVLASGEQGLESWEAAIYSRVRQRFLFPACKLCRYRIPQEEVPKSWTNGGYCNLCAEAMR